jgi:hypothetical protein
MCVLADARNLPRWRICGRFGEPPGTAVQVVWTSRRGSRQIEHLGSAHCDDEVAGLKLIAAEKIATGQAKLDLALDAGPGAGRGVRFARLR